jgi:hypothetical protein
MATFTGNSSVDFARITQAGLSSALGGFLLDPVALTVEPQRYDSQNTPKTLGNPIAYPQTLFQGVYSPGIDQEFYGHIIVNPRALDLGLVLSAKLFTIGVWNLTGYDQRMLSWTISGLDGVTITNADGYPVRYGPMAYRAYQVTVGTTGAAQITGSIVFNFEGISAGSDTSITGSRLIVFSFEPNWREPVSENLEWLTDVLSSHNDREQRLMLRQDPRRAMKYLYTFESQNKVNFFQGLLWGWQQRVFVVPVWTDWQYLSQNVSIGATTINVSTSLRDFSASNLVLLWRDYLTWEIVEVNTLTSSQITLKKATIGAWTTKDRIIPIRLGRLSKTLSIARPTATLAEATLQFTYEVGEAVDANRLGTSSWLQFQGLDVLTVPPNVGDTELTEEYERDMDTVDQGKGSWAVYDHSDGPMVTRPYSVLCKTRQEIMNLLAFLETRKGKLMPFWMPTWSKDLEQVQDMGASDLNILVKNIGYTRYIKQHANRSVVIFFPADNSTPIIKTITGSAESSNNTETISFDSSFGSIKKPADFKAISFLTYCRMDQDAFELVWHSDSIATMNFRVREVLK